jgi:UDP-N-acetylmuramoyl-L-alanyl-D-glutamate--2,6-diaminopimelate ligase
MGTQSQGFIRPAHPGGVTFRHLIDVCNLTPIDGKYETQITGVTIDSRTAQPGDLYVGMPGSRAHGASFLAEATANGARAFLTDAEGWEIAQRLAPESMNVVPGAVVEHPRSRLGMVCATVFGTATFEALMFGVTGTNGKTSVIYLLAALVESLGLSPGISTTAERRIGDEVLVSSLTSPEAPELHALLARMRERDVDAVGVEVSAQAVHRHRIDGVMFDVVAFNNFSQDHLDEFGTMEAYFAAKSALFQPKHAKRGVVVVDSDWGRRIVNESAIPVTTLATEFGHVADWHLAVTHETLDRTSFVLSGPDGGHIRASVPLVGRFMAENAALAMVMLIQAGVSVGELNDALAPSGELSVYIPGRLERVSGDLGPRFYVDYGHTPGAFDVMLSALRGVVEGKIIMLFGADGDRDSSKRAAMGAIAARGSDLLIICDYNPRNEDPALIRSALLAGARDAGSASEILEIADPGEAIRTAIQRAGKDDVILYAGPGHETYREVAGANIPFSARDEVRGALREAGYAQ